jgi:hypothetical protein
VTIGCFNYTDATKVLDQMIEKEAKQKKGEEGAMKTKAN